VTVPRGAWARLQATRPTRGSFWKYNWISYERTIAALERARRHAHGALLDVGCGDRPFAYLFDGCVTRYVGADLHGSRYLAFRPPDVYARSEALPFRDGSFQTVLGLSMLSYLPEPEALLNEARRVLAPDGVLLLEFPQMVPALDEGGDYLRFTRQGAALLLGRAGFEPVEYLPLGGLWTRVGMSCIAPLNRINRGPTRALTELPVRLLYSVIQLACAGLDRAFFDPREVVGNLVVARKVVSARTPAGAR